MQKKRDKKEEEKGVYQGRESGSLLLSREHILNDNTRTHTLNNNVTLGTNNIILTKVRYNRISYLIKKRVIILFQMRD